MTPPPPLDYPKWALKINLPTPSKNFFASGNFNLCLKQKEKVKYYEKGFLYISKGFKSQSTKHSRIFGKARNNPTSNLVR